MIILELMAVGVVAVAAFYYFRQAGKLKLTGTGFKFRLAQSIELGGATLMLAIIAGALVWFSEVFEMDFFLFCIGVGILVDVFRYLKLRHRWN